MNFCKKCSLYLLILVVSFAVAGCSETPKRIVFKRDSAYDTFQNQTTSDAKPHRVGNVVYMGSDSSGSKSSDGPSDPSFDFDHLRR